jgi:hypothetical protein
MKFAVYLSERFFVLMGQCFLLFSAKASWTDIEEKVMETS